MWVSFAMIVGVMGTALISPLYPLYKQTWQLQPSDISLVYVVYMAGALFGLLFIGRLPDRIGFKPVMQAGLILMGLGTLMSLLAWNLASLIVGRIVVGVASSMMTTGATMGMNSFAEPHQGQRVATLTSVLIAFGFGLGPLVGGVMGQWAPMPLVTTYIPTLVLGMLGFVALGRLKLPAASHPAAQMKLRLEDLMPKLTWPQRSDTSAFVLTCAMPFLAFGVFGLYAAMSPLFLDKLVPWHGPVVSGTAIALILFASAAIQVMATNLSTQWCSFGGMVGLALSNIFLMLNLWAGSGALFALGVLFTAAGHGLSMMAGMRMINRIASPHNRSGLLSTYLLIGYVGCMLPMMAMGWIADHFGMTAAVCSFCIAVSALSIWAGVLARVHPRMQSTRA